MPRFVLAALAILLAASMVISAPIREVETPGYFIHIPIDKDVLKAYLTPPLVPDLYNGQAYVQVAFFHIKSLHARAFGTWFPMLLTGDCARTSALVLNPLTGASGYMILSADFETGSLAGKIATLGCRQTNWMVCGSASLSLADAALSSTVSGESGVGYKAEIDKIGTEKLTDLDFWKWSQVNRAFRWEQTRTYYQERESTEKDAENAQTEVFPMTLKSWKSTVFAKRWPGKLDSADAVTVAQGLCNTHGYVKCFKANYFTFVDGDAKIHATSDKSRFPT